MSFRTRFAWLCNIMFPCFSFADESDEDVDQEFPCFDSYGASKELPESVIREILLKLPVESISTYRVVCKSWYGLVDELSDKSDGDQNSNGMDSSYVSELPDLLIRDILLNLPVESIRGVCKAWNQFDKELSDVKEDRDKTSHRSDSSRLSELHNSVIHEIFLKLPIKSIDQCRYACKSWYKLISDPYFAKVYFNNPTLTSIAFSQHESHIRCPDDESFGFLEIGRKGDVSRKPMNMKALTSPVPVPGITNAQKSWKTLIGSCDGLLCLVETPYEDCCYVPYNVKNSIYGPNQTVWIVNPLIGEYMELPKVHGVNYDSVVYGFGSTVDGDHYKVLRIARKYFSRVVGAQILTIGAGEKWRDLDISTFPSLLYSQGVTLNGALHFVGYGRCGHHVIYVFDICKETGRCFTFPFEHDPFRSYLVAWDGHLCITDNIKELQVDLWTMKQYGVVESWRRDIILTNNSSAYFYALFPITTMKNGDLLLLRQFDQSLMSFDPRTKKCVELQVSKLYGISFSMFAYTPSFVSLRGMISGHISI